MGIIFKRDHPRVKKPQQLKRNVFVTYSPRTVTAELATCIKIDTNITLILPKKAKAFVTSKFRGEEIFEMREETQRLWIEILNKSYIEDIKISKNNILGFVVIEPEHLSFKHETPKTKKKKNILPKTWSYWEKMAKKTKRGFAQQI